MHYTEICIPQAVVQVPITVLIQRASGLDICSESGLSEDFANFIEPMIVDNYKPPILQEDCKFLSLSQISCVNHGELIVIVA